MLILFSFLAIGSFLGLVWLFVRQMSRLATNETVAANGPKIHLLIESTIDYLAFQFVVLCRDSGQRLTVFTLSFARELASLGRRGLGKLEQRFSRLINLIKGREPANHRGAVSFFLREIDEYKRRLIKDR